MSTDGWYFLTVEDEEVSVLMILWTRLHRNPGSAYLYKNVHQPNILAYWGHHEDTVILDILLSVMTDGYPEGRESFCGFSR